MVPKPNAVRRTCLGLAAWLALCAMGPVPAPVSALPAPAGLDVPAVQSPGDPSPADREAPPDDRPLQGAETGSGLTVSLITVGAGPRVWEMFGHNAIRIRDPARGLDVSYNWGMFDFGQEGFFWRFLLGDWQYWMAGLSSEPMIDFYVESDRGVVEQELELTPAQRATLLGLAERNARPENRFYRYQYFLDNCSTRVRDILDVVLDGSLGERFTEVPGRSFRFHTRRLTEANAVVYVALDFFMSGRGDRPIAAWHEMFIPMELRDFLRGTDVVASEVVLDESSRPRPLDAPPRRFAWFAVAGALLAGLLAGSAALAGSARAPVRRRVAARTGRLAFVLFAGTWSLVAGLSGLVMIVSHFTRHEFMHWNENFLQANPLSLVLAGALVAAVSAGAGRRLAVRTALLVAGVSLLGFVMQVLPGLDQVNGYHLAVAVPAHLALAWGMGRVPARRIREDGP